MVYVITLYQVLFRILALVDSDTIVFSNADETVHDCKRFSFRLYRITVVDSNV